MFNRKVLVIALMAVVLLTSFMDAEVGIDRAYRHKRRLIKTAESISVTVPALLQANLESLMNQAADQGSLQASGRIRRHPRKGKTAFDAGAVNQVAYGISADDPGALQADGRIRREPRKRRIV